MPLTLPPLNSLRAFEAAARTGSFTAAAEEIGVSAAAISQHVKKLEDYLGKTVFTRQNNRVTLTDAGHSFFESAASGLQIISDTTEEHLLKRSRARLVISAIESVTEKWLTRRIAEYCHAHPDFRFDLRVEPDPVDFARHNIDLRLAYDGTHYPELELVNLPQDVLVPVCSPDYLARHPEIGTHGMAAVPDADLLHTSWGPSFGTQPSWQKWHSHANLPQPVLTKGFLVHSSAVLLDLAREGLGVALGQRLMIHDDVEAGRLVRISDLTIPLGRSYCLAYPRVKQQKRHLLPLIEWLRGRAVS
ncbi:LysR substrate-binding domain-containing protein [Paracoccus litorisediminis]|uniref:LysR family transcriptional regulator n=1 Tax=Paracoccus litorisediminis TaxID=2006130 RepID=A0A844HKL9_9RHOB|nr:LysR substrate-binding domain-containing protein [Paracoccus litorisediminis]MTH59538.1 LysR family transcriptional regulator [Paracoccus litorisediminis]